MFAVIYQGYTKSGREQDYQILWNKIANYFVERRGAIGSYLHRSSDGMWVAYSRWPDKATRDASWPGENAPSNELPEDIRKAISEIKDCIDPDRKISEICLTVVEHVGSRPV
ncbi:MAG TPA: hypothetical protein VLG49_03940 [Rhabdochlamydiaceae bacterium]|nr:hypothetical protein [Rhabdochlamydiaceae bacterium]